MIVGLLYGEDIHHLDHLAPLCSLLNVPLIVNDEKIYALSKIFYPNLSVSLVNTFEVGYYLLENAKLIISCLAKSYLELIFFPYSDLFKKKVKTIWCPHGNSDKGLKSIYFEALVNETCILVYGEKMLDVLKAKKITSPNMKVIKIGNYRKRYYEKHIFHYQNLVEKHLPSLKEDKKKYLYAPTWEDDESNSSVPLFFEKVAKLLKISEILFIKLHPNTLKKEDLKLQKIIWELEENPQVHFIRDFPPIYPILDNISAYLGDFSSIGYDALSFKIPMGFLLPSGKTVENSKLFSCGITFSSKISANNTYLEKIFKNAKSFTSMQDELYQYNFSDNENLKEDLLQACE